MSWLDSILVPVNREGYPFIAFGAVIAFVLFFVYDPLGWAGVLVTLGWCSISATRTASPRSVRG